MTKEAVEKTSSETIYLLAKNGETIQMIRNDSDDTHYEKRYITPNADVRRIKMVSLPSSINGKMFSSAKSLFAELKQNNGYRTM